MVFRCFACGFCERLRHSLTGWLACLFRNQTPQNGGFPYGFPLTPATKMGFNALLKRTIPHQQTKGGNGPLGSCRACRIHSSFVSNIGNPTFCARGRSSTHAKVDSRCSCVAFELHEKSKSLLLIGPYKKNMWRAENGLEVACSARPALKL